MCKRLSRGPGNSAMLDIIIIITAIVAIEGQITVAKCTENAWDDGFLEAVLNVREKNYESN